MKHGLFLNQFQDKDLASHYGCSLLTMPSDLTDICYTTKEPGSKNDYIQSISNSSTERKTSPKKNDTT